MYMVKKRKSSKTRAFYASKSEKAYISVNSDEFVFTQASIVSSVLLEPKTHLIDPRTAKFVNSNGDSWSNESLKANYQSFIGAFNYINHIQEPSKAVGFIADSALRRIMLDSESGAFHYYVDLLIATHRDNSKLCAGIVSGDIKFLSMGCEAMNSQCSQCGHKMYEEEDFCPCLVDFKGKQFIDSSGQPRVTSELLGNSKKGSCDFIEASYLTQVPAFGGACRRNVLQLPGDTMVQIEVPKSVLEKEAIVKFCEI